jgi:hypothetical protein
VAALASVAGSCVCGGFSWSGASVVAARASSGRAAKPAADVTRRAFNASVATGQRKTRSEVIEARCTLLGHDGSRKHCGRQKDDCSQNRSRCQAAIHSFPNQDAFVARPSLELLKMRGPSCCRRRKAVRHELNDQCELDSELDPQRVPSRSQSRLDLHPAADQAPCPPARRELVQRDNV